MSLPKNLGFSGFENYLTVSIILYHIYFFLLRCTEYYPSHNMWIQDLVQLLKMTSLMHLILGWYWQDPQDSVIMRPGVIDERFHPLWTHSLPLSEFFHIWHCPHPIPFCRHPHSYGVLWHGMTCSVVLAGVYMQWHLVTLILPSSPKQLQCNTGGQTEVGCLVMYAFT